MKNPKSLLAWRLILIDNREKLKTAAKQAKAAGDTALCFELRKRASRISAAIRNVNADIAEKVQHNYNAEQVVKAAWHAEDIEPQLVPELDIEAFLKKAN